MTAATRRPPGPAQTRERRLLSMMGHDYRVAARCMHPDVLTLRSKPGYSRAVPVLVVLGGELAVPCHLQSAIAGLNSLSAGKRMRQPHGGDTDSSLVHYGPVNPVRPGREQR